MGFLSSLRNWGHDRRYAEGMHLFNRGDFEAAAACFEAVCNAARDPRDPDTLLARCYAAEARAHVGLATFHAGDDTRAEREFTLALTFHPGFPELRYYRARIRERSGRLEEAIEDLQAALADRPRSTESLMLLAVCLDKRGDREGAIMALDSALAEGFPLPPRVRGLQSSDWDAADWRSLPRPGAPLGRTARSLALERDGDLEGAIAEMREEVEEHPRWPDLRCRLGTLLLAMGEPDAAVAELMAAIAINPRYLAARIEGVRAELEAGRPADAATHATEAVAAFPEYPDLHYWLGICRARAGNLAGAQEALERAVEINRQFARAQRLLGLVHHAQGKGDDALSALRRGFTRDRELPGEALRTAAQLLALRSDGGVEAELLRAIAIQPDYPDLHLALARSHRAGGALENARDAYKRALELAPAYDVAALELALVELALGALGAAEARLAALLERRTDWPDAHAMLGRIRLVRGDAAGAEAPLREAVRRAPTDAAAQADLGWVLRALGREQEAGEAFSRALEQSPTDAAPRRQFEWREQYGPDKDQSAA